jgi:plasmid stabilization system protein ParE
VTPASRRGLSRAAARDLAAILDWSLDRWGPSVASETEVRLLRRIGQVAEGSAAGHQRPDIRTRRRVLFLVEAPWLLAFDPEVRVVLRILHGRRDVPSIIR